MDKIGKTVECPYCGTEQSIQVNPLKECETGVAWCNGNGDMHNNCANYFAWEVEVEFKTTVYTMQAVKQVDSHEQG